MNFIFQILFTLSLILPLSPDDYQEYPENYFKLSGLGGLRYRGIVIDTTGFYFPLFPEFHFNAENGYITLERDTLKRAIPETQIFSKRGGAYYSEIGGGFVTRVGLRELEAAVYFSNLKDNTADRSLHYAELSYLDTPRINIFYLTPGEEANYGLDLRFPWAHFFAGRGVKRVYEISLFPWKQASLGLRIEDSIYTIKTGYGLCTINLQKEGNEFTPGYSLEFSKKSVFLWSEYGKSHYYERSEEALRVSAGVSSRYFLALVYYKRALQDEGVVYFRNPEGRVDSSRSSMDIMVEAKIPIWKLFNFSGAIVHNSRHSNLVFIATMDRSLSFKNGEVVITPELVWDSEDSYLKLLLSVVLFKAMEVQYIQYRDDYRFAIGARLFD